MNEERHWDKIGQAYDKEIFDVFNSDRNGILRKLFRKYGNQKHDAIDFGCGTGKAFRYLSPKFKHVTGVDISNELLQQAAGRGYKNISVRQLDLTSRFRISPAHFAFCCNVVMLPEMKKNLAMLRNIARSICKGGVAVIVLPSLDSFLYSTLRLMEWYQKEGVTPDDIPSTEFDGYAGSKRDLIQGLVYIDKVETKHYSLAELELILPRSGFEIVSIDRVEYEWNSEFSKPPSWLKEPFPWDWVAELKVT